MSRTSFPRAVALVAVSLVITLSAASAGTVAAESHTPAAEQDDTRIDVDAPANVTRGDDLAVDVTVTSDGLEPWAVEVNLQHENSGLTFYAKEVSTTGAWERHGSTVEVVIEDVDFVPGDYSIVIESAHAQKSVPLRIDAA